MDPEIIRDILTDGTYAISGDNSQPWRFDVRGSDVTIFNIPDRDNPILNIRQRGSYVAHGSLIETIIIAANKRGYAVDIRLFPRGESSNEIAVLSFSSANTAPDPLYEYIRTRASNRRPYDAKKLLTEEQKREFQAAVQKVGGGTLSFVEDSAQKKTVGAAMSATEKTALTTKELHHLFFKDMVWTEAEEREKKSGLYIRTLELPPPVRLLFRAIQHWPVMKFLNALGFYKLAAAGNAETYASCALFGAIVVGNNDRDFITAGRITQRVWLTATRYGLAFQVVTGVPFLYTKIQIDKTLFKPWQCALITQAYLVIKETFGATTGTIAMLFRTGYAPGPSARSSRMPAVINFK